MNALVSIDNILEPTAPLNPSSLFGSGQVETIISAIEKDVRAEVYDIATEEGRERIKSVAYKIARSKTTLDDIGKEHVAAIKLQSAKIDKERKSLRDRLDALKDEVRGPLTAWEEAEKTRVEGHEAAIVFLIESTKFAAPPSIDELRTRLLQVQNYEARDFEEFAERARTAGTEAMATLSTMLEATKKAEADAAELAELRRLKAEREEADRKAAEAAAAADQARLIEEARAERERQRAEQAKRNQEAAVARAIEQERQRAEREKVEAIEAERRRQAEEQRRQEEAARIAAQQKAAEEAAERKRQENKRHRAKVHAAIIAALAGDGFPADSAAELVDAIVAGKVPHISITY